MQLAIALAKTTIRILILFVHFDSSIGMSPWLKICSSVLLFKNMGHLILAYHISSLVHSTLIYGPNLARQTSSRMIVDTQWVTFEF